MKRKLLIFTITCLGLSFSLAGLFYFMFYIKGEVLLTLFASFYMFLPLISVLITQILCGEKPFSDCYISFRFSYWWIVASFLMLLITILSVALSIVMPGVSFTLESDMMKQVLNILSSKGLEIGPWTILGVTMISGIFAGFSVNAVFAFGEEIAWRGFLARLLESLGFWRKSILIGAVWGIWHAPLILMGHNYPMHPVAGVFMMTALCIALSPVMMYLKERSKSVIAACIAHGTMNAVAAVALVLLSGYNDLLCGVSGLAGIIILLSLDGVLLCLKNHSL